MIDRRRRVLFLLPTLRSGGAERVIVTLLRHLDRQQFQLAIAVVDMRDAAHLDELPDDVELIDLQSTRVRYALPKILRLIWRRRPEVVFSSLGHLNLALAMIRPLLPNRVRYYARESCLVSALTREFQRRTLWRWAYRRFYNRFDAVVCQSVAMRDDLVENFELRSSKARVIQNPIDVAHVRRSAARGMPAGLEERVGPGGDVLIHLLAVGRLVEQKGFDLLIDAIAQCRDARLRLTVVGEGPLRDQLQAQALRAGVAAQVRLVGFQRNPYPFFALADVFVLSSRFEGFPNVVLEALACGIPVIATPAQGGVGELLQAVAGCEVATDVSSAELASAISRWIDSPCKMLATEDALASHLVEHVTQRYAELLRS